MLTPLRMINPPFSSNKFRRRTRTTFEDLNSCV